MFKRYRAYDEIIDKWRYFKIVANEQGWEVHYLHGIIGDKSMMSEDDNFNVAYENMLKIVERMHLTKLAEVMTND